MIKTCAYAALFSIAFFGLALPGLAQKPVKPASFHAPTLKIGSGDLLRVKMFEDPDLSGQFRVDSSGDIALPLLGRVHVAGQTADHVGTMIAKRYVKAGILQPEGSYATVSILEYATQGITVNGEVKKPGVYPALGVRMLNEVIASAGGELPVAASKVIITHQGDSGDPTTVTYNPFAAHPKIPHVQIFPGDTITVPKAGIVYVVGDVKRPGGFVLNGRQSLTIEEAMALAGGTANAAALKRVQLVRTLQNGRKEAVTVSLKKIFKGKAPDVALKDGDVIYVPTSTGKLVTERALTSAIGIGTQVAIYRSAFYP